MHLIGINVNKDILIFNTVLSRLQALPQYIFFH